MEVMEITVESMIAVSPGESNVGGEITDEPIEANDRRGGWGNLWN